MASCGGLYVALPMVEKGGRLKVRENTVTDPSGRGWSPAKAHVCMCLTFILLPVTVPIAFKSCLVTILVLICIFKRHFKRRIWVTLGRFKSLSIWPWTSTAGGARSFKGLAQENRNASHFCTFKEPVRLFRQPIMFPSRWNSLKLRFCLPPFFFSWNRTFQELVFIYDASPFLPLLIFFVGNDPFWMS